jgi:6-pyruvoyl-tetrahydropterin synthase
MCVRLSFAASHIILMNDEAYCGKWHVHEFVATQLICRTGDLQRR